MYYVLLDALSRYAGGIWNRRDARWGLLAELESVEEGLSWV